MATIRVRARTVDMLGRQQIAGIPTAINELFKNAHDAYAKLVTVDFYRRDRLFVLRDDGIGMTPDEFTSRWLTLGTESKMVEAADALPPPVDVAQQLRPVLGEKGIGRLAVAILCPHILIATRAKSLKGEKRPRTVTIAFINWDLFRLPGIDLDQIEIPITQRDDGELPGMEEIGALIAKSTKNIEAIGKHLPARQVKSLVTAATSFAFDLSKTEGALPSGPRITGDEGHGTHFYVRPVDATLDADLTPEEGELISPMEKLLIGFSDQSREDAAPVITPSFRIHSPEGVINDFLEESQFFTRSDFEKADHRFTGRFDENGTFTGSVRVFNAPPEEYTTSWPNVAVRPPKCGPFDIDFAYLQGAKSESTLDPFDYAELSAKLKRVSGMYIYRDGVRVLPYGNSDFDFIDVEKRRSKGAGYYFFSYRRMFGAIRLTRAANSALEEKAGREGFRQNSAYRDFKSIVSTFMVQLAADFFRTGGASSTAFLKGKEANKNRELRRRAREKERKAKAAQLQQQLAEFAESVENDEPKRRCAEVRMRYKDAFTLLAEQQDIEVSDIEGLVSSIAADMRELRSLYRIDKPSGFGLSRDMEDSYVAYEEQLALLEATLFVPLQRDLNDRALELQPRRSRRLKAGDIHGMVYRTEAEHTRNRVAEAAIDIRTENQALSSRLNSLADSTTAEVASVLNGFLERVKKGGESEELVEDVLKGEWDDLIHSEIEPRIEYLSTVASEIRAVAIPGGTSSQELNEALEEQLIELEQSQDAQFELIHLGKAIGIIQHEFRSSITSLRQSLTKLKRWADVNTAMKPLFTELRANFDHLDAYLGLFTPLTRRLYRTKVDITGAMISKFLMELFGERLKRQQVEMRATQAFERVVLKEYPSSVFPVFVNIIDNAIYWMEGRSRAKSIVLDLDGGDITITDSGPGVAERDRERIFEMGFSRRKAGQGLGLYVSKEVLKKIGYELTVDPPQGRGGAVFRIRKSGAS